MSAEQGVNRPAVRIGDTYSRNGRVVVVTAMDAETVTCELTDWVGTYPFTVSWAEFRRLEQKSLEAGAVFEPAGNGGGM